MKHLKHFDTFLSESAFHAALAKAKKEGLQEFEFQGKKYPVKEDALKEGVLNENVKPYDPQTKKELEMMLEPLFKKYGMEVSEVRPDSLVEDGTPVVKIITYNVITGGTWTAAQFFNQKDAQACVDMFNETEVGCASKSDRSKEYRAVIKKDTMGKTLFFGELSELNENGGVKLDMDAIRAKGREGYAAVK